MANLNLSLVFKLVDQVTAPLRRVGQIVSNLQRPFKAASLAARGLWNDLKGIALAGAAVGAALGVGIWQAVRRYADLGDAADETAQKLGVGVLAFTRWSYAAKFSGVEAAALEDSLKFLNLSSSQAAAGSKTDAEAFRALGLAYKDANGNLIPLEQLLPQVAERFKAMKDGAAKTQIAVALFGRSGLAMIPMLNEGADGIKRLGDEAERLGVAMSEEQAKAAAAFNDSLGKLQASVFGLGNGIAGGLLPQLTSLIKSLTAMIAANRPEILRRTQVIFTQISAALPGVIQGVSAFARFLGDIAGVVGPVVQALGGFGRVLDVLAVLMIGRVAIGIWSAVSAVWGLNAAMLANPVGLVIAGLAALAAVVFLVIRNWKGITAFFGRLWAATRKVFSDFLGFAVRLFLKFHPLGMVISHWSAIVGFFKGLWARVGAAFRAGIDAVWNILPGWFRQVLRGVGFVVKVASNVGATLAGGGDSGRATSRPQIRYSGSAASAAAAPRGLMDIRVHHDRPPTVAVSGSGMDFNIAPSGVLQTRGGG
ncbi:phage tail tape measure protein [Rhizobium sp. CRIBSB]|nr:phage tail tape measure protein [Rhizobium sp. CRIBSB]